MRTPRYALEADAVETLEAVLQKLGLHAHQVKSQSGGNVHDLVVTVPNRSIITLEVKATSVADPGRVVAMLRSSSEKGPGSSSADLVVLVADQISEESRELLQEHGWGYLDRRGRIWLRTDDIFVNDTEIEPQLRLRPDAADKDPLAGRVGVGISLWMLMHPGEAVGVRAMARELDCAPSTAHDALNNLRAAALVGPDNTPLIPELFWAVADRWRPERHHVTREPQLDDGAKFSGLVEGGLHIAISNDIAAAAWGAPVVVRSGDRPDFYVPADLLSRLVRLLGPTNRADRGATVAAAPIHAVCRDTFDHPSRATRRLHWPLAHPVVVALDLAQDRSRGREILDDWDSPEGFDRVW